MPVSSFAELSPCPRRRVATACLRARARAVTLLAALLLSTVAVAPAGAVAWPTVVTGTRLSTVTATSLTVTANASTNATGYRLYASRVKSDVYVVNIRRAMRSPLSSTPRVTLSGLYYSTDTWYYRFGATNSAGTRYSDIYSAHLRPARPTSPAVRSGTSGTSLTWSSGSALGYRIAQASNSDMVAGRVNYVITSQTRQFTPYGLTPGTRYYFQVAALNGTSKSTYSAKISVVARPRLQPVKLLTYNVLTSASAGQIEGDGPLAPWSQRRAGVARLIKLADPDLVALQEAGGWATSLQGYGGVRQVDDLVDLLRDPYGNATYGLVRTEVPPTEHMYLRTGRYILYKKSAYSLSGSGGHWQIGTSAAPRFAAYQVMVNRTSGARFLFVSVHLSSVGGLAGDEQRATETQSLLRQASAYAGYRNVPVVYAGDFNSHQGANHPYDGPGETMRAAKVNDAFQVAQAMTNAQYNSANGNVRTPPASGRSIDHVYGSPGVALTSWRLWLQLSSGTFVGTIPSDHNPLTVKAMVPYSTGGY